jgi:choline-phosphate cytidylyltransferase
LEENKIDFVAHDADPYYSAGQADVYEQVKLMGKFLATQRTPSISTSELITRIVKDYNDFVRRNLERGVSPKELNLSLLKEGEIWMEKNIDKFLQELKKTSFQVRGLNDY